MATPTLYSQDYYRGLIVRDPRISFDNLSSGTTWVSAGPEPDQPSASVTGGFMQLEAAGEILATTDLDVLCVQEGTAAGGDAGGRFAHKAAADAATLYNGHLNYNKVTGFENIDFSGSAASLYKNPHAICTPDHTAIVAYHVDSTIPADSIKFATRAHNETTWSTGTLASLGAGTSGGFPALVQLPNERIVCFYVLDGAADTPAPLSTEYGIGFSYSDDDGATWTVGGRYVGGARLVKSGNTIHKMRAIYHNGYVTIALTYNDGANDQVKHLVSDSLGAAFVEVEELQDYADAELWADDAGSVIMVHTDTSGSDSIKWAKKSSAFSPFNTNWGLSWAGGVEPDDAVSAGAVAVCRDRAGWVWTYYRHFSTYRYTVSVLRHNPADLTETDAPGAGTDDSNAKGDRWLTDNDGAAVENCQPIDTGSLDTTYLSGFCVVPYKSSILLIGNHVTGTATTDGSLSCVFLGGDSSVDWPRHTFGKNPGIDEGLSFSAPGAKQFGICYFPIEIPDVLTAWTKNGAGTPTLTANGLDIDYSGGAAASSWNRTGSTSGTPCIAWARVKVVSGGSLSTNDVVISVRRADGTVDYQVDLRLTTTGARAVDVNNASATIASDVSGLSSDTFYDWLIAVDGALVSTWYKLSTDTQWTVAHDAQALTDGGPAGVDNQFVFGQEASSTAHSAWLMFLSAGDDETSSPNLAVSGSYTNPTDLQGREFSVEQQYLADGVRIASRGSAAYRGDAWDIVPRYEYGIANAFPEISTSPREKARSTTDAGELILEWDLGTDTSLGSTSIGLTMLGCNFSSAILEGYDGAWDTLGTLDFTEGLSSGCNITVDGDIAQPHTSSNTGTQWYRRNELVDSYLVAGVAKKIVSNEAGAWKVGAGKPVKVRLADVSGITNPVTGNAGELVRKDGTLIVHKVNENYSKFRVRIPAFSTVEGYFTVGELILGPVVVFGKQPDWGRNLSLNTNVEVFESRDGARRVQQVGPNRRTVEFGWADGWEGMQIQEDSPDPDHIKARDNAAYDAIGVRQDFTILEGILDMCAGGEEPVVYLPRIPPATADDDSFSLTARGLFMAAHVAGGTTRVAQVGDEWDPNNGELQTVDTFRLEELV